MLNRFEQFSYVISGINRYIQKLQRDEMEKYGYKGSYTQYLVVLSSHPEGLTATKLCEACDKDKAAVSRMVAEMEKKQLIYRENDRLNLYRAKLKLTEEGKKAASFVSERARAAVHEVDPEMTEEEREVIYACLDRINTKLQSLVRDGIPDKTKR